jgi:hypothetical protein
VYTDSWPTKDDYIRIREAVVATDEGRELIEWAETVERPKDADDLAMRLIGAVITSGFGSRQGKIVFRKVVEALRTGQPVYESALPHTMKAPAIEQIWGSRQALFDDFCIAQTEEQLSVWCDGIPYVRGPAISRQVMRDLGAVDVAKPDRLLLRIAERAGDTVAGLCERLAKQSGDRVGTVDAVLWFAASRGIIKGISRARSGADSD